MNSVKSIEWSEYDADTRPRVVVRMSPEEKQALQRASKDAGVTVAGLVLAYMRPVVVRNNPDGRRAHQVISNVVQAGIEHYRNGKVDANQTGKVGDWRGIQVALYEVDGATVMVHHIVQREGHTRAKAVEEYVNKLLDVWAELPSIEAKESMLDEIRDGRRHLFRLAYSNAMRWSRFPGDYELEIHRAQYQTPRVAIPDASDADEMRLYTLALDRLMRLWPKGSGRRHSKAATDTNNVVMLPVATDADDRDRVGLMYYPHRPDAENVTAWAGQVLHMYRHELPEYGPIGKVDAVVEMLDRVGFAVRVLRVDR
jgi:hypothetical protein